MSELTIEIAGAPVLVRGEDARALAEAVAREHDRLMAAVADDLLEDKNDAWLEEGEAPLTAEAFRARLTLAEITRLPDGRVELVLDDDGMFWGHALTVLLDAALQIQRVNLEG